MPHICSRRNRAIPKVAWVPIPLALARQHPQFGLRKGGLLALGCLFAAGLLRNFAAAFRDWGDSDVLQPSAWSGLIDDMTIAILVLETAFLACWFSRWRHCRIAWLGLTLLEVVAVLLLVVPVMSLLLGGDIARSNANEVLIPIGIGMVFGTLIRLAIWWFMGSSAAYRVTFEQRVAANDPILLASGEHSA